MWETFNRVLSGKYSPPYENHDSKTDVHFINAIQRGARPPVIPSFPSFPFCIFVLLISNKDPTKVPIGDKGACGAMLAR